MQTISETDEKIVKELESATAKLAAARTAIGNVIFGQSEVVDRTLAVILSGGHGLLVGLPGLAKTRLVEALGHVLGLNTKRIQFTPDLMPADIVGSEVLEETETGRRSFRFIEGPVFCQLLMADEINRASPRTQSALLQSMQEHHVTVAGARHELPEPFHVLATQNPLEQEGTYPLPEAQLDRFLLQIDVGYPSLDAEREIVLATTGAEETPPNQALSVDDLLTFQKLVRRMPVGEKVLAAILDLVRSARPNDDASKEIREQVAWGPGPRASQALVMATRARALIDGRYAPSIDDVLAMAQPVLKHRMALTFAAGADGVTVEAVVADLCAKHA